MKKLIVDCSRPLGQQEVMVDMTAEEIAAMEQVYAANAAEEAQPKPKTLEQRLAELEQELTTLKQR